MYVIKKIDVWKDFDLQVMPDPEQLVPEIVISPTNSTQKLIRNGNIYILTDDSRTYTITGQKIK